MRKRSFLLSLWPSLPKDSDFVDMFEIKFEVKQINLNLSMSIFFSNYI